MDPLADEKLIDDLPYKVGIFIRKTCFFAGDFGLGSIPRCKSLPI